ncbi:MAG: oligopeptidase A [Gammaproteobacteria bacterium RIFOXYA12_FULL_61_12]|nr:MAG: oligopeptidase A [Gammaproteobacteria bacterium RIFOXYD12_FULL_61_37]OGT92684.1 MAG: oligopeptidase A [Gammaproteobacteria bacterium RIFOXYA12_FULL_61_12]
MSNPLLEPTPLPAFSRIKPEHVLPAIEDLLQDSRTGIARLLQNRHGYSWKNLIAPIEELDNQLDLAWSPVSHLNSVADTPELREAYNTCLPKLAEYAAEMGHNRALYLAYREVAEKDPHLNPVQRKVLDNALRDFHLAGVDLPDEKKARYKEISQELSRLTSKFEQNLLDATHAWSKTFTDPAALAGLPSTDLGLARQTAEERGEQGWIVTLDFPSYYAVMTYADDPALRREMYEAYATRASDRGPHAGHWDNGETMEQILALRHEAAQLLGFANYAERSLVTKMASSTEQVERFLLDLAERSLPQARHELDELRTFAMETHGASGLEVWDIGYYSEKLRRHRYAISQEELKPYFPATRVIPGLFAVAERLFGIRIAPVQGVDVWHPEVQFFEVRDPGGELRGEFYLDLHARPHKRGGAWMDDCAGRFVNDRFRQTPVAYLTCNFSPPVGGRPALLTHSEVETLFHEFGHGLHHMLTRIDYPAVSGINGVAWDAVELPSQFMENYCWERDALALFAGHYETGEPLPGELYERMLAAKHFQSGMQMVRQLEFSLFDLRIHRDYDPAQGGRINPMLDRVREQVSVVRPPEWNRFPHGFSHIFAGGYAAGYYSYKWAEVLSADAFSLFEEKGIFDPETGMAFLRNILEKGGSEDAMNLFTAFRGREPDIAPLLRHSGINQ